MSSALLTAQEKMPRKSGEKTSAVRKRSLSEKAAGEGRSGGDSGSSPTPPPAAGQEKMLDQTTTSEVSVAKDSAAERTVKVAPASPTKDAATDPVVEPDVIKTDILKDLLECPVCLRVPRTTPIFQCARGHVVCGECKPNVTTCPQCREPLGNIRSLVSEKVLEKLPASCKYADHGCQVELMRGVLAAHERHCQCRVVNCVDLACQQKVPLSGLLSHLDSDHETEDFVRVEGGVYSSHFIVNEEDFTKDIMWISDQLHFDSKYFYRECCRSNKGLWYIWVYMLETKKDESENYLCEICINSGNSQDQLLCRGRPISVDLTKENIAESGKGLVFTDTTARLFWQDNKVRYSVSIRKKDTNV